MRAPLREAGDGALERHPGRVPELVLGPADRRGRVRVLLEYRVPLAEQPAFAEAMRHVAAVRRRTGGRQWALFRDGDEPELLVETYLVPSWDEHVRQHIERHTLEDQAALEHSREFQVDGHAARARHLFALD